MVVSLLHGLPVGELLMMSPLPQPEKSTWQRWKKKDSILQRHVLELADRNSKKVSCTGELLGHGLKYTPRLVRKENLRGVQKQKPKTELLDKRIRL